MTTPQKDSPLARLEALGFTLPAAAAPVANYVPFSRAGALLFVSGQLPMGSNGVEPAHKGKLGGSVSLEHGQAAARVAALNVLAQAQAAVGDLSRLRAVRLGGFVNSAPTFAQLPQVVNGASDLIAAVLGENGKHARFAVGVAQLPLDAAVEVEGIFEIFGTRRVSNLSWLVERPIAHRGLHDPARGVPENSIAAARAAIDAGYAIECDVQLSKDGEAIVFHDDALERLTGELGLVNARDAAHLARLSLLGTSETIPTFSDFLAAIAGGSALVVEIKSNFDGNPALVQRVAEIARSYKGRLVIESFDPDPIAFLRQKGEALGVAHIPLGMVGMASYDETEWPDLAPERRVELKQFLHFPKTRPDFLSWNLADLPHAIPLLAREGLHMPVTTWTVRSNDDAQHARKWADQIVFEGFRP